MQKSYPWYFPRLLCLSVMDQCEKDSRDEPKELWIHGRAYLWAMDMPQSKRNENRYFCRDRTVARVANRLRGVSDLIHPLGRLGYGPELAEIRCNRSASRYPASIMRLA